MAAIELDDGRRISGGRPGRETRFREAALTKVLSLQPDDAFAHTNLAGVELATNRGAEGIAELEHALALNPNLAAAQAGLGFAMLVNGRAGETEAHTIRWHLAVKDRITHNAARAYLKPTDDRAALEGHLTFFWDMMDAWFEEDEQVFVHPRDPYTRVDTVHSSRHVRVEIDGVTLGETRRPMLLFETGLPTRYYIPKLDVRIDLLEPSEYVTSCPYKGVARHWSARVGDKLTSAR